MGKKCNPNTIKISSNNLESNRKKETFRIKSHLLPIGACCRERRTRRRGHRSPCRRPTGPPPPMSSADRSRPFLWPRRSRPALSCWLSPPPPPPRVPARGGGEGRLRLLLGRSSKSLCPWRNRDEWDSFQYFFELIEREESRKIQRGQMKITEV